MCGIAGFSVSDADHGTIDSQDLAASLLLAIMSRGQHATGAAWTQQGEGRKSEVWYAKRAVPATKFMRDCEHIPLRSRTVILHTRYATQGSPKVSANNHPIMIPGVIGVHNGHVNNDDELIAELGVERLGEVDSEAAFHLVNETSDPTTVLGKIDGRAALAWIRPAAPRTLHLARVTGSPLWLAQTAGGSTLFCSTQELLAEALEYASVDVEFTYEVPEMTYVKVRHGVWEEVSDIVPFEHPKPEPEPTLSSGWGRPYVSMIDRIEHDLVKQYM